MAAGGRRRARARRSCGAPSPPPGSGSRQRARGQRRRERGTGRPGAQAPGYRRGARAGAERRAGAARRHGVRARGAEVEEPIWRRRPTRKNSGRHSSTISVARATVTVAVGETKGLSTAAIEAGEREVRQTEATRAVEGDPFVQDLVKLCDAKVDRFVDQGDAEGSGNAAPASRNAGERDARKYRPAHEAGPDDAREHAPHAGAACERGSGGPVRGRNGEGRDDLQARREACFDRSIPGGRGQGNAGGSCRGRIQRCGAQGGGNGGRENGRDDRGLGLPPGFKLPF